MWTALSFLRFLLKSGRAVLTLQRVRKLKEQAAISDDVITGIESGCNLGLSLETFAQSDGPPSKLIRRHFDVHEGLVFTVAQHGRIRHGNRVLDSPRIHRCDYVHVLLQLLAGVARLDARLQSARVRIQ